ncbi:hypothetical protein [Streptomyces sp. NPDC093109]|uniref:hypothetical protein n=1 Tax=Streptomyces sp. NPDC093109 TaxID=3154977 RepID=UPI00344D9F06
MSHDHRSAIANALPEAATGALRAITAHFETYRPEAVMTEAARMTVALGITGSAAASRPILRILPWPTGRITRGEYALRLRKAAWAAGCSWSDDDNRPAIPRIPSPRPASHTGDSDPDQDEALRRVRGTPTPIRSTAGRCPGGLDFEDCRCTGTPGPSCPQGQSDVCPVCEYWTCRCTPWTGSAAHTGISAVAR